MVLVAGAWRDALEHLRQVRKGVKAKPGTVEASLEGIWVERAGAERVRLVAMSGHRGTALLVPGRGADELAGGPDRGGWHVSPAGLAALEQALPRRGGPEHLLLARGGELFVLELGTGRRWALALDARPYPAWRSVVPGEPGYAGVENMKVPVARWRLRSDAGAQLVLDRFATVAELSGVGGGVFLAAKAVDPLTHEPLVNPHLRVSLTSPPGRLEMADCLDLAAAPEGCGELALDPGYLSDALAALCPGPVVLEVWPGGAAAVLRGTGEREGSLAAIMPVHC